MFDGVQQGETPLSREHKLAFPGLQQGDRIFTTLHLPHTGDGPGGREP